VSFHGDRCPVVLPKLGQRDARSVGSPSVQVAYWSETTIATPVASIPVTTRLILCAIVTAFLSGLVLFGVVLEGVALSSVAI
jgi:hypothetical protein